MNQPLGPRAGYEDDACFQTVSISWKCSLRGNVANDINMAIVTLQYLRQILLHGKWIKLCAVIMIMELPTSRGVGGTQWRSWLRNCAASLKVAGSIPDDLIGMFH